ncbi:MAG: ATP-binding protein [Deltaproteobacteria bacterium]|nr:ATP-binding protein [Deltaproteobacteria bacterium]
MYRFALDYLKEWKNKKTRKPLVIRGARQVGKSFLVEMFSKEAFENFVKIDFEKMRDIAPLFESKSPKTIIPLLEVKFNTSILPGKTLLFLDEIQAAPDVFATIRYFYEDMPALHVIAAGSLLEFILAEHEFSMPVGRIEYLHLGPMQFEEFLMAVQREKLRESLCRYKIGEIIHSSIHGDLLRLLKQYLVIGGMPEVVSVFSKTNSFRECEAVQQSIISTYRDDFNKYSKRANPRRLEKIFSKVPQMVGNKFKYSRVDHEEKSRDLRASLQMLSMARVAIPVYHSSANGVPLRAEMDESKFKVLFLDVGLLCRSCGLSISEFERTPDVMMINAGAVCEQFIGQHLLYSRQFYDESEIFYWIREKKTSNAEVDYLISIGPNIIPVEVKSGKSGTLKSLQVFLCEKKRDFGLRFSSNLPSLVSTVTSLPDGNNRPFKLLSLPLYMVGQTKRLCSQ